MGIHKDEARAGAPVPEETGLDVVVGEGVLQQSVGAEEDHGCGEVVCCSLEGFEGGEVGGGEGFGREGDR